MIVKFKNFLKEGSIVFSDEDYESAYSDNDNASMYDVPPTTKPIKQPIMKDNSNLAIYTKERLIGISNLIKIYPEYYAFIEKIVAIMDNNGWDKVYVPNHIDTKLAKYNIISKLPENNRFKLLKSMEKVSFRGITKYWE